jgi:hypothetical protein
MAKGPIDSSNPADRPHQPQGSDAPAKKGAYAGYRHGQITAKPLNWLGMHFTAPEAQKLWTAIMQQLNTQIKHDQDRAIKAIKKLRKSETGEGDDDN